MFLFQTMGQMNKVMDPMKTAKVMQDFERQNAKMEMTEEMSTYPVHFISSCRFTILIKGTCNIPYLFPYFLSMIVQLQLNNII